MSDLTLFGAIIPGDLADRYRLINALTKHWTDLIGRPPGPLETDLDELSKIFGAGVSPRKIKDRVYKLPQTLSGSRELPDTIVLILDGSALITPEGRILLDFLLEPLGAPNDSDPERLLRATSTAVAVRSEWHATWLRDQFDSSISAPALGAALFLLVNGSIGESNALNLPKDADADRELGDAVLPLIANFSRDVGGNLPITDGGIRGHWAFTQVSRLLGRDVARVTMESRTDTYVREGRDKHLLDDLAQRLNKLERHGPGLHHAVTTFIESYRQRRGFLAAQGQMHEDPTATKRIVERILGPGITT